MPTLESFSTNETSSTVSHAITAASGVASGDFLVAGMMSNANTASQTFNTPTGWTKREESLEQFARQFAIYTRTADGGANDAITVTTGTSCDGVCFYIRISSHNGYGASDISTSPGFDSTETSPSVSVTASSSLALVFHFRSGNESATITEPGSTTSIFDDTHTTGAHRVTAVYATVNPSSTGTFAWSWSGDGWNQAGTLVVEAAAGGGGSILPLLNAYYS